MSWIDRVVECTTWNAANYLTLALDGEPVGRVHRRMIGLLDTMPDLFAHDADGVWLQAGADKDSRSAVFAEAIRRLAEIGAGPRPRGEIFPVRSLADGREVARIDRCAMRLFGLRAFGVHLNGYVRRADGLHLWIGRRAAANDVEPGKLDNMVAGGQPADHTIEENLVKECAEEAGMDRALALRAKGAGAITYKLATADGLRDDVLFVFDLEVPEDFRPRSVDGEHSGFELMPLAEAMEIVATTNDFKSNVNLVLIDFAIRHGFIVPDHPHYLDMVAGLRQ